MLLKSAGQDYLTEHVLTLKQLDLGVQLLLGNVCADYAGILAGTDHRVHSLAFD